MVTLWTILGNVRGDVEHVVTRSKGSANTPGNIAFMQPIISALSRRYVNNRALFVYLARDCMRPVAAFLDHLIGEEQQRWGQGDPQPPKALERVCAPICRPRAPLALF